MFRKSSYLLPFANEHVPTRFKLFVLRGGGFKMKVSSFTRRPVLIWFEGKQAPEAATRDIPSIYNCANPAEHLKLLFSIRTSRGAFSFPLRALAGTEVKQITPAFRLRFLAYTSFMEL